MTIMDWINIGLSILILTGIVVFIIRAYATKKHILVMPEYKKSHKRIETRLLNHILDDMRNNPHEWIATPYDPGMQREPHFVNDKKNMAVIVGNSKDSVLVKINLTSAAKYMEQAEDIIATPISGDHVKKFLRKVDECIDTRGKELSLIENMLKDKL